ncbi:retrotransposon protein, putative, ty1-copia subclass [Tanacetum coccineum]
MARKVWPYKCDKDTLKVQMKIVNKMILSQVISRDDLTELYRIVMNRYGIDGPEDELEKLCKAMLDKKLQGGKPDENCYKMLKMMEKQAGLTCLKQTATGKGISNPFMAVMVGKYLRGVVSFSCLLDLGFKHTVASNGISVSLNGIFYFSAISVNGVFEIDINNNVPKNNSIFSINKKRKLDLDSSYLWHCRLAHIGKTRMQKLHREGLLENIDEESFDKCESCISGKMTKKPFNKNIERATDLLGLIHTDVCGPLRHVSRKGASYFLTFTDDFSRYGYVYLLKHKHEVFETFKVFKAEVELQLGKKIKALRSDRGGEYLSQEFKDYLSENGIVQNLTSPFTPQQNESAVRILNMVPTKKVDKTPYEIWHGKAPNLSYLKVWGCEAYVKRDSADKLQQRSVKCIFVGYPKETMGYYFYFLLLRCGSTPPPFPPVCCGVPENKVIVASQVYIRKASGRDVVFLILYVDDILIMGQQHYPRLKIDPVRLLELNQSALPSIRFEEIQCHKGQMWRLLKNLVSRYQQNQKLHWFLLNHILNFERNTKDMFLVYGGNPDTELDVTGFCDESWQCDKDDTKSQDCYVFNRHGGAVDWKSKKQTTIAMHATQSEYMAASEAAMEAVWIRKFVGDLGVMPSINKPINMYCDNSAAIIFANEPGVMKGARHFLRRYHYVREQVESGEIKLIKVHTDKNLADAFTKALPRGKVNEHANGIGLRLASSFMHICD